MTRIFRTAVASSYPEYQQAGNKLTSPLFYRGLSMTQFPVQIQKLPPAPDRPDLHFDKNQFDAGVHRVCEVTLDSRLTHGDRAHMQISHHPQARCRKWLPIWASNETQFRAVIMARGWAYVHAGKPMPADLTFQELKKICDESFARLYDREHSESGSKKWTAWEFHKVCVQQHGGYLAWMTTLLYKSLRLGYSSSEVAEELGAPSAVMIRQAVYRANKAAERLGFPVHEMRHHSKGRHKDGWVDPERPVRQIRSTADYMRAHTLVYRRLSRDARKFGLTVHELRACLTTSLRSRVDAFLTLHIPQKY